jgi:hypothetical protein
MTNSEAKVGIKVYHSTYGPCTIRTEVTKLGHCAISCNTKADVDIHQPGFGWKHFEKKEIETSVFIVHVSQISIKKPKIVNWYVSN